MSLGLNVHRRQPATNLPGATGVSMTIALTPAVRPRPARRSHALAAAPPPQPQASPQLLPFSAAAKPAAAPFAAPARPALGDARAAPAMFSRRLEYVEEHLKAHASRLQEAAARTEVEGTLRELHEAAQWVYAEAVAPLVDVETGEPRAAPGARVLLLYPMREGGDDAVDMRLKTVDRATGQLALHWVRIREAGASHVANFALA